ncbi:MAG: deiodinase-like protein [Myxococcota bacterium]
MWLAAIAACGGSIDLPTLPGPAPAGLRSATELVTDCFDYPEQPFDKHRHADVGTRLTAGDRAVDFTLRDVKGNAVRLADLLVDKPVLLVQGSWTCPRFQQERPGLEQTVKRFRNDVTVVLVYGIEAHPGGNDPSPYRGKPWPEAFSDRKQPKTYDERLRNARDIARDASMRVVVDAVDAPGANPVWCTYGTCPSCSWLIRRDGTIAAQQEWHDQATIEGSIAALLAEAR